MYIIPIFSIRSWIYSYFSYFIIFKNKNMSYVISQFFEIVYCMSIFTLSKKQIFFFSCESNIKFVMRTDINESESSLITCQRSKFSVLRWNSKETVNSKNAPIDYAIHFKLDIGLRSVNGLFMTPILFVIKISSGDQLTITIMLRFCHSVRYRLYHIILLPLIIMYRRIFVFLICIISAFIFLLMIIFYSSFQTSIDWYPLQYKQILNVMISILKLSWNRSLMNNLRALNVIYQDDTLATDKHDKDTSINDELIEWLQLRLPVTYKITRNYDTASNWHLSKRYFKAIRN
jgi:hypothetical protein